MLKQLMPVQLCFSEDLKTSLRYSKVAIFHPVISKSKIHYCACRPCIVGCVIWFQNTKLLESNVKMKLVSKNHINETRMYLALKIQSNG